MKQFYVLMIFLFNLNNFIYGSDCNFKGPPQITSLSTDEEIADFYHAHDNTIDVTLLFYCAIFDKIFFHHGSKKFDESVETADRIKGEAEKLKTIHEALTNGMNHLKEMLIHGTFLDNDEIFFNENKNDWDFNWIKQFENEKRILNRINLMINYTPQPDFDYLTACPDSSSADCEVFTLFMAKYKCIQNNILQFSRKHHCILNQFATRKDTPFINKKNLIGFLDDFLAMEITNASLIEDMLLYENMMKKNNLEALGKYRTSKGITQGKARGHFSMYITTDGKS